MAIIVARLQDGHFYIILWQHISGLLPLHVEFAHTISTKRIITFSKPRERSTWCRLSTIQSKTAIGREGFLEKVGGEGTQTHLEILSARVDFILSVIVRRWDFSHTNSNVTAWFYTSRS